MRNKYVFEWPHNAIDNGGNYKTNDGSFVQVNKPFLLFFFIRAKSRVKYQVMVLDGIGIVGFMDFLKNVSQTIFDSY